MVHQPDYSRAARVMEDMMAGHVPESRSKKNGFMSKGLA